VARVYDEVPELRSRPSVPQLSEGRRSLRRLWRGLHAPARRRLSGLSCDHCCWSRRCAGTSYRRGCLRPSRLAANADLGARYRVSGVIFVATNEGSDCSAYNTAACMASKFPSAIGRKKPPMVTRPPHHYGRKQASRLHTKMSEASVRSGLASSQEKHTKKSVR
jgi:hypothetical protein